MLRKQTMQARKKPGPRPGTVRGNGRHMRGATLADRVLSQATAIPISGCWIWTGALNNKGYGLLMVEGKRTLAHRAAYEAFVGPITKGLFVLHQCDVACCVNPAHMMLGTQKDNMQQASARGRIRSHGILRAPSQEIRL